MGDHIGQGASDELVQFLWPQVVDSRACWAGKLGEYHAYEPALLGHDGLAGERWPVREGPGALAAKSFSRAGDGSTPRDSRASWQRRYVAATKVERP